jgi:hypothetical protein
MVVKIKINLLLFESLIFLLLPFPSGLPAWAPRVYSYLSLVAELQFGVKHPKGGVNTQPHIALCTVKFCFSLIYKTLQLFAFLRPVTTIFHFGPASQRG